MYLSLVTVILPLCLTLVELQAQSDNVHVSTATGTYRGVRVATYAGNRVRRFLGVRYAEAPEDTRRFKVRFNLLHVLYAVRHI